jgi:uncharacterized delta-60 repeat protein
MNPIPFLSLWAASATLLGATPVPFIQSIDPVSALPGAELTVHGAGFYGTPGAVTLYVGPVEAVVTHVSPERLEATLPSFLSHGRVAVTFPGDVTVTSSQVFQPGLEEPGTLSSHSFAAPPRLPWQPPATRPTYFSLEIPNDQGASGPSQGVKLADLNRDGRPDILVANWNRDVLIVFENVHEEGNLAPGSFSRVASHPTGVRPLNTAVGDLNGNGWLDVVVGSWSDSKITFLENTTGTPGARPHLTPRGAVSIGSVLSESIEIHIADFDGDGLMDVIIGGNNVTVVRAKSPQEGLAPENYSVHHVGESGGSIAIADLDGSGRPDVIVAPFSGGVRVFRNQSTPGAISVAAPIVLGSTAATAVAAEDLLGNGKPDIIAAWGNRVMLFENTTVDGELSFADPVVLFASSSSMHVLKIGATDVSGDGVPDIWIADRFQGMMFAQNSGEGGLGARFEGFISTGAPAGDAATGMWGRPALGDLNGNGRQDVVTDGSSNRIFVVQNLVQPLELERLVIQPAWRNVTLPWYRGNSFQARGIYNDGSEVDLTNISNWEVSDSGLVDHNGGRMIGRAVGDVSITATYQELEATAGLSIRMMPEGNSPGYPDIHFSPTFGGPVWSLAHQSGGTVLAGGEFQEVSGRPVSNLVRIRPDTSVDETFSANLGLINGVVNKVLVLPDDSIYIAGAFTEVGGHSTARVALLHPNGTVNTSFRSQISGGTATAAHLYPGERILVGQWGSLRRLRADGALDTQFAYVGLPGDVRALGVDHSGRILVGGGFNGLRRLLADGSPDGNFVTGTITNTVNDLVIQSDGKIVCAGSKSGEFVIRLNEDGTADETFDQFTPSSWGVTNAVALDAQERILVPRHFTPRRLVQDGTLDPVFGTQLSPDFAIEDMVVHGGDLWIAGGNSAANGIATRGIARIHLDATDFETWRGRHFSYGDLHERELAWHTVVTPGERPLLYYYIFNQDPRTGSVSPFDFQTGGEARMGLRVNPTAFEATIRLLYSTNLQAGSWAEFARRSAYEPDWTVADSRFSINDENDGTILIEFKSVGADALFLKATAILD